MENKLVTSRMVVYGEGCISPVFIGSVWTKDDCESDEAAETRYSQVIKKMGFEYLKEVR